MYCILHFKAVEFPCHKFSSSRSFVVLLRVIRIPDILASPFPVYFDITDGDCGFSLVSDRSFSVEIAFCWSNKDR